MAFAEGYEVMHKYRRPCYRGIYMIISPFHGRLDLILIRLVLAA